MKDLVKEIQKDKVVIETQKEIKKELKFLGSQVIKPGHTLFQVNTKTFDISPAVYESVNAVFGKQAKVKRTLIVNENCIYIGALNAENVARKILKILTK